MKKVKKTDALGRRAKRTFSQEDKLRFYEEWKLSGLSKPKFCQAKGLTLSAFLLWGKKIAGNHAKSSRKKAWIPVVSKNTPIDKKTILVEIQLPNEMKFTTSLDLPYFISMLKELCDAFAIVR